MFHGVDIVEITRIEKALKRWGVHFLRRVYTDAELELCRGRVPELAVRFAGKEAVMKALGKGMPWRNIEILSNQRGAPLVYLYGKAKARARELEISEFAISLSHSKEYAIASVIGGRE